MSTDAFASQDFKSLDLPEDPTLWDGDGPLAINEIHITEDLFREAFLLTFSHQQQRILTICGGIIALAGAIFLAIQLLFHRLLILGLPLILMGIAVIILALRLPKTECRRKYKAMVYRNQGSDRIFRRTVFYPDSFRVYTGQSSQEEPMEMDYSEITQVLTSDHLLVLNCEGRRGILLDKKGFLMGSADALPFPH